MRRIENWSIVGGKYQTYRSPEDVGTSLFGAIYDHEKKGQYYRYSDGEQSLTSEVIGINNTDIITVLSGSNYILGKPSNDYENEFPNARKRLIDRLLNCR